MVYFSFFFKVQNSNIDNVINDAEINEVEEVEKIEKVSKITKVNNNENTSKINLDTENNDEQPLLKKSNVFYFI
jgi:hypothetical protein